MEVLLLGSDTVTVRGGLDAVPAELGIELSRRFLLHSTGTGLPILTMTILRTMRCSG